jgi:hypothetical protein
MTRRRSAPVPKPSEPAPAPAATGTACRIQAHADGIYCCGMSHPAKPCDYPDGWFTATQLEELAAHPALQVTRLQEVR